MKRRSIEISPPRNGKSVGFLLLILLILTACDQDSSDAKQNDVDRALANKEAIASAQGSGGEKLFMSKCAICHSVEMEKTSAVGPHLAGVLGRPAGSLEEFSYSSAMQSYGKNWTTENLDNFLLNPALLVPGNRMAFAGLSKPEQRQHIIEYLALFK
jgi:cytochrome c